MNSPDGYPAALPKGSILDGAALQRLQDTLGEHAKIMIPTLVEDFFKDSIRMLTDARRAVEQKNASDLRRCAHTLKSNGATFGAMALSAAAKELEFLAKEGTVEGALPLIDRSQQEFEKIKPLLENYGKSL